MAAFLQYTGRTHQTVGIIIKKLEKEKLELFMFGYKSFSEGCENAKLNGAVAGKSAYWIAQQAGFEVDPKTSILMVECSEVGPNEPLTREKLSPVLAMLK